MRVFITNPLVKGAFITPEALVQRLEDQITGHGCYFEIWEAKRLDLMTNVAAKLPNDEGNLLLQAAGFDLNDTEHINAIHGAYADTLRSTRE